MRRTKEDAAVTREHLLEAALHIFHTKGYVGTTLDDIARAAGTTRGAIHWHFGSKAELYNTLIRESYQRAMPAYLEAFSTRGTPLQTLRRVMEFLIGYVEDDTHFRTIMEITLLRSEIQPELAQGLQEKAEGNRIMQEQLERLIKQGITLGEIRADVQSPVVALAIMSLTNGIVMQWLFAPDTFPLKAYGREIVAYFLTGIAVP